ncbi:DDE_3 domain-containing protein [Trichonephila clavipes]|nr:DDE_3 domain-containing protein [Trichonephila clavipes]
MVWGVYSWSDMRPLIRLDMTLTGDRYLSILSDSLHPFMFIVPSDGLGAFHLHNKISLPLLTPTDLWAALQDSKCQLLPPQLQTSIESMPRHVAALQRARWGHTRY